MSRRKLAWIVLALVGVLSAAGLFWTMFGTSVLVFTETEIQSQLNQQLPKTVRELTIERVAVRLAESRLALRVETQGTVMRQPVSAVASARGVPRYEAQKGEMYFDADEVKIEQLAIAGRSIVGEDDTRRRLTAAVGSATQRLAETAIKAYLATRPVYRFKEDFKGVVLKAALVDVKIEQNVLRVTFSLWNLTMTVAIFALVLIGVLLVIYLLIRHPLWGLGMIAQLADD
jgi:hypothetical protein